jgi:hypothetical protein
MLYIVCPESHRYKEQIDKICEKIAIKAYQILDPRSHNVNRAFNYVIVLGQVTAPKLEGKVLIQTRPPAAELPVEDKMKIFNRFKEMQRIILIEKESCVTDTTDIPRVKDLESYLKDFNGQVIEVKLQDGRVMGIYPDNERLAMKYSVEKHVSSIVNLARLKELFDIRKISVKDL